MRIFIFLLIIHFSQIGKSQPTYTFHTAGNWTNAANWSPSYPGTDLGDINGYIIEIQANCLIGSSTTLNINSTCGIVEIYVGFGAPYAHLTVQGNVSINNGYNSQFFIHSYDDITFSGNYINFGANYNGFYNAANINFSGNLENHGTGRTNFEFCTFNTLSIEISYPEMPQFGNKIYLLSTSVDLTNTSFNIGWSNSFAPSIGQDIGVISIDGSGTINGFNSGNFTIAPITGLNFTPMISADNKSIFIQVSAALPITYKNQPTAKLQNNITHISWSVVSQLNNEKYIIEHSNPDSYREALKFSPIGEIVGDGTSNEIKNYEYIHTSPSIGINYYRIKQLDFDGKYSFSDIASVRYDGSGETNIFPNPASSEVTITTTERTSLQIMDVYGKLHSKQEISEGQNTINISGLPCGILTFVVGDQRYKVLKE